MTLVRRALRLVPSAPPTAGDGAPRPGPSFAEVYETHFSFVWRNARRLGTPAAGLEDVAQEIFVGAYRRIEEFEGRSSIRTWLLGILVNVVRAHRRKLMTRHPHILRADCRDEVDQVADAAGGPDEGATRSEATRLVEQLMDAMGDEKREAFVLAELEQMTAPEISAALSIPLNTVYSRLRAARREFAKAAARHRAVERGRDGWSKP